MVWWMLIVISFPYCAQSSFRREHIFSHLESTLNVRRKKEQEKVSSNTRFYISGKKQPKTNFSATLGKQKHKSEKENLCNALIISTWLRCKRELFMWKLVSEVLMKNRSCEYSTPSVEQKKAPHRDAYIHMLAVYFWTTCEVSSTPKIHERVNWKHEQ